MDELFGAVRKLCPTDAWSLGVSLSRQGAVYFESSDPSEAIARVEVPGAPVAPRVELYPEDAEWECDCESRLDACEHVAAAVIALSSGPSHKPAKEREELPRGK